MGLGSNPLTYAVHVSTLYPLINEVIVIESLACKVGGDIICVIPKAKDVLTGETKRLLATIEVFARYPLHIGEADTAAE